MKKFMLVVMVLALFGMTACSSLDGTTSSDIQKAKDGNPVDMHGK